MAAPPPSCVSEGKTPNAAHALVPRFDDQVLLLLLLLLHKTKLVSEI